MLIKLAKALQKILGIVGIIVILGNYFGVRDYVKAQLESAFNVITQNTKGIYKRPLSAESEKIRVFKEPTQIDAKSAISVNILCKQKCSLHQMDKQPIFSTQLPNQQGCSLDNKNNPCWTQLSVGKLPKGRSYLETKEAWIMAKEADFDKVSFVAVDRSLISDLWKSIVDGIFWLGKNAAWGIIGFVIGYYIIGRGIVYTILEIVQKIIFPFLAVVFSRKKPKKIRLVKAK